MKRLSIILLFALLSACATQPKQHTYLKYSGYMEGCADGILTITMSLNPEVNEGNVNQVWLDATCMELYLEKLERENLKPPMKRYDKNEMI